MVRLTENFFLKIISEAKMLSIEKITQLAKENSTPLYIFDKDELADRISSIKRIVGDGVTICYAMKDRKSTRLNSSHYQQSRMPSSA